MTAKSARRVWVFVALQVIFLLCLAGYHESVRLTSPTIRLKTMPVDPRDVVRGDYMTFGYDIGRPDKSVKRAGELRGEVFVVLKPEGRYHAIEEILTDAPSSDDSRLWVRATAWGAEDNPRLDYGIERFFVPEGRGRPQFKTIEVDVAVSATHRLYIEQVWVDGKRFP
jgi:uncharacterized membrane-anchored protein